MSSDRICQCCSGTAGVENVTVFNTDFVVCAYCRGIAKDVISSTYIWRRRAKYVKESSWFGGSVVVFDGDTEILRRGFGVNDHEQ